MVVGGDALIPQFNQRDVALIPSRVGPARRALCAFSCDGRRVGRVSGIGQAVLAHQGGWDEILLVLAPMVVVAGLLWIAKRRVDRTAAGRESDPLDTGADRR